MRAAQIAEYGDVSVIQISEVALPSIGPDQILVKVSTASLNPFDSAVRSGSMQQVIPLQLPVTLGGDIAGEVIETGNSVTSVSAGDLVFGQAAAVAGNSGAFAQYAATKVSQVSKIPDQLSIEEAASLPLVGVSALQAITQHLGIQSGQKIFITGGGGGIGRIAIQIAKHRGAFVATTASGDGIAVARGAGADIVIDYKISDFTDELSNYDAVFDTVGGDQFMQTLTVLVPGGAAVTMSAKPDEAQAKHLAISVTAQMTRVTTDALDQLRDLVETGVVTPLVGQVYPLDKIQDAFVARESGSVTGKIVVKIA